MEDVLVDLSQEHALQSIELGRHLLGEVLQVSRLDHLQPLKNTQDRDTRHTFNWEQEKKKKKNAVKTITVAENGSNGKRNSLTRGRNPT